MKRVYLLFILVIVFTLSACQETDLNMGISEESTAVAAGDNHTENDEVSDSLLSENKSNDSSNFLTIEPNNLSTLDFEKAYKLCTEALSEYYKSIWNGIQMDVSKYIDNPNLKQFTEKKITSQYNLFRKNNLTSNQIKEIKIGAEKVDYVEGNNRFFYLKLNARITKDVGSYAEPTEFLVQNLNGKLVIADWYTSGKDSYDSTVRGENQNINNPYIWNEKEWVNKIK
ncbi:hypothetical protein [Paenibacillus sp. TC-CSREp1]|uniref:hypothetical protein n=1 Tax=Paenibacillus sp. TC-CSREp1 TaxID=3410089 RepID=UPI003D00F13B